MCDVHSSPSTSTQQGQCRVGVMLAHARPNCGVHCEASVSESANQVRPRRRVVRRAQDQHRTSKVEKGSERPKVQHMRGGSETAQVQRLVSRE